jgi:formimidoylglutamate deiminase
MYRFALTMTPDRSRRSQPQLYVEMLEAGFTRVGEFHYLHHDRDGGLMPTRRNGGAHRRGGGDRHRADAAAGVLRPFRLRRRGAGDGQRRFINDVNRFARLLEARARPFAH